MQLKGNFIKLFNILRASDFQGVFNLGKKEVLADKSCANYQLKRYCCPLQLDTPPSDFKSNFQ